MEGMIRMDVAPETYFKSIPPWVMFDMFRISGAEKTNISIRLLRHRKLSDVTGTQREVLLRVMVRMIRNMGSSIMPLDHGNLSDEVLAQFGCVWKMKRMVVQGLRVSKRNSLERKFLRSLLCATVPDKVMRQTPANDLHCSTNSPKKSHRRVVVEIGDEDDDEDGGDGTAEFPAETQVFYRNMAREWQRKWNEFLENGKFGDEKHGKRSRVISSFLML